MYVEGNGRHQRKYDKFYEKLVPPCGPCMTLQGEVLRAVTYIYKKYYNERIFADEDNAVGNAWGFLHEANQYSDHSRLAEVRRRCDELVDGLPFTPMFDRTLESLFDSCVLFASSEPVIEIKDDMFDEKYKDAYRRSVECPNLFEEKTLEVVE